MLLFGTFFMTGFCFSTTPTFVDTSNDEDVLYSCPLFTDMREIWIDHNTTYLQFKMNLGAIWNQTGYGAYVHVSINDATGSDLSGELNFSADYTIALFSDDQRVDLIDWVDSGNDLDFLNSYGLGYYLFTNNNQTLEIGIRLQSSYTDKGYFNVSVGQTIKIQLQTGGDTDYAPNAEPLSFTLEADGAGIPGFNWALLHISLLLVMTLYLTRKRAIK